MVASTEELAGRRERLADLRHWHERSPSSYQALPEMAGWLEEAWAAIDELTVALDQAQRDLATAEAGSVRRLLTVPEAVEEVYGHAWDGTVTPTDIVHGPNGGHRRWPGTCDSCREQVGPNDGRCFAVATAKPDGSGQMWVWHAGCPDPR